MVDNPFDRFFAAIPDKPKAKARKGRKKKGPKRPKDFPINLPFYGYGKYEEGEYGMGKMGPISREKLRNWATPKWFRITPRGGAKNVLEEIDYRIITPKMADYEYAIGGYEARETAKGQESIWIKAWGNWARQNVERLLGMQITSQEAPSRITKAIGTKGGKGLLTGAEKKQWFSRSSNLTNWRNIAYNVAGPISDQEMKDYFKLPEWNIGDEIRILTGAFRGEKGIIRQREKGFETRETEYTIEVLGGAIPMDITLPRMKLGR